MSKIEDRSWMIPEEIKSELAETATEFCMTHQVNPEFIGPFMSRVIKIYDTYLRMLLAEEITRTI